MISNINSIMMEMHSKYDNMHENRIFNALNYINNHLNSCINCMLSLVTSIFNFPQLIINCNAP